MAFTARLKDAVDLDTVRDDLASAVQQALGPHVSVWISQRGWGQRSAWVRASAEAAALSCA